MTRLLEEEGGYSLVEVIVSILLLSIAIIPMVGMLDAGLKTASLGADYDKGRALAKKQLESARSLPYGTVSTGFPSSPTCSPAAFDGSGRSGTTGCADADFPGFTYEVEKRYLRAPATGEATFANSGTPTGYMRHTVTVRWGNNSYRTSTLKVG